MEHCSTQWTTIRHPIPVVWKEISDSVCYTSFLLIDTSLNTQHTHTVHHTPQATGTCMRERRSRASAGFTWSLLSGSQWEPADEPLWGLSPLSLLGKGPVKSCLHDTNLKSLTKVDHATPVPLQSRYCSKWIFTSGQRAVALKTVTNQLFTETHSQSDALLIADLGTVVLTRR